MGYRVNKITVSMEVYQEFEGVDTITFTYAPTDQNDPLVKAALDKNQKILVAQTKTGSMGDFGLT